MEDNPAEHSTILLAPHNDDEALFASFICLRERPLVVVVTDSWIQYNRGEKHITAEVRRGESAAAMKVLGCRIAFLGISDAELDRGLLRERLRQFDPALVYAPAIQGGHRQHDLVGAAALEWFPNVIQYSTCSRRALYTTGEIEIKPTVEELRLKRAALDCYRSQLTYRRTAHHFAAVDGKSEWITRNIRLRALQILWNRLRM